MVMVGSSTLQIVPGPRPSIAFTPALGVVLTDWYIVPLTPVVAAESTEGPGISPTVDLFFVPYRLSFNRLSYRVANIIGEDIGDIGFAIYTLSPVIDKILEVTDTFDTTGTKTVLVTQTVLEPGLYWLGRIRTLPTQYNVEAYGASGVSIIGNNLPDGASPYGGALPTIGYFPQSFDPMTDLGNVFGSIVLPKMRLYTYSSLIE